MIITIDGPSGTGKSTVAKKLARRLGFSYFDTGAIYRTLAWWVLKKGIDPLDEKKVIEALPGFECDIQTINGEKHYFANKIDVTKEIRTQPISMAASQIAVYLEVRRELVKIQREYGSNTDVVFEGRDMGTVVFPHADLKIYLTARPEVRAERRYKELLQKNPNLKMTKEHLLQQMQERDVTDTNRKISPLKQADDAVLIDTSECSADEVVDQILQLKKQKVGK